MDLSANAVLEFDAAQVPVQRRVLAIEDQPGDFVLLVRDERLGDELGQRSGLRQQGGQGFKPVRGALQRVTAGDGEIYARNGYPGPSFG